jgi:ribosomal protein L11 methylase PrmA
MTRALLLLLALVQAPSRTPDIHFVPTSTGIADAMLEGAHVTRDDVVYDLGSGEGDIVIEAAVKFGARGVGVELDPKLVATSRDRAEKAGVADRVEFRVGDLFEADIAGATVVTLYLSPATNLRLEAKLVRELKPGTRVVSHRFEMAGWIPDERVTVSQHPVFFYTMPPHVAGAP